MLLYLIIQVWSKNPIPACHGHDIFIQKWFIKRQNYLDSASNLYPLEKLGYFCLDLQNTYGHYATCRGTKR